MDPRPSLLLRNALHKCTPTDARNWCDALQLTRIPDGVWDALLACAKACPGKMLQHPFTQDALLGLLQNMARQTLHRMPHLLQHHPVRAHWQGRHILRASDKLVTHTLANVSGMFPLALTPSKLVMLVEQWRSEAQLPVRDADSQLREFLQLAVAATPRVFPLPLKLDGARPDLRGRAPTELLKQARTTIARSKFAHDPFDLYAAQLSILLFTEPASVLRDAVRTTGGVHLCGSLALLDALGSAASPAGAAAAARTLQPQVGKSASPPPYAPILGAALLPRIGSRDGAMHDLVVFGAAAAPLCSTPLRGEWVLVQGCPFVHTVAAVCCDTAVLHLWKLQRSSAQSSRLVEVAKATLACGGAAAPAVTWAEMCADPPLLAWGTRVGSADMLSSAGEVPPLRDVRVVRWKLLTSGALQLESISDKDPEQAFDGSFGAVRRGDAMAMSFPLRSQARVWWAPSGGDGRAAEVWQVKDATVAGCWQATDGALVVVQQLPAGVWRVPPRSNSSSSSNSSNSSSSAQQATWLPWGGGGVAAAARVVRDAVAIVPLPLSTSPAIVSGKAARMA